jgi:hypothetical protein
MLIDFSMTSPAKMSRDDSSPRSLDTNGSRFASPSTAPTMYSPIDTRGLDPISESMFEERFARLGLVEHVDLPSDDPFIENGKQTGYLSAAAVPYHPVRAPITELNATSTPDRMTRRTEVSYDVSFLDRNLSEQVPYGSLTTAASFNLQPSSASFHPRPAINSVENTLPSPNRVRKHSVAAFSSDPDDTTSSDGTAPLSRYLCLGNVDAGDIDERNPRSRLRLFREVSSILSFHCRKALPHP